ncbi:RHS repeat-associated core domain-containing protein [Kineosporia sp. NBRC 101731]|uniref:RHS repeat-associated core domain-containing protein n=1 Tax=Kineosporia sp. NBRC 101731 TaxID=3032199 RepID=UPI00332FC0C8
MKTGIRYYDPIHGRFTQQDPTGQEENPYLYAAGGPATKHDPTGANWFTSDNTQCIGTVGLMVAGLVFAPPTTLGALAVYVAGGPFAMATCRNV